MAGAGVFMLLALVVATSQPAEGAYCEPPLVIFPYYGPDDALGAMARRLGGLPKAGTRFGSDLEGLDIYPVTGWTVEQIEARNMLSLGMSISDDDPNYWLNARVRVQYADGEEQLFRWRSWRIGVVLCPFLISYGGSGPPGQLEAIEASNSRTSTSPSPAESS